jgi:hypothetical protein
MPFANAGPSVTVTPNVIPASAPNAFGVVLITGDTVVTGANRSLYDGWTVKWSTAAVMTITAGLDGFGFVGVPPAAGNASIAFQGATGNGASTTITRAAAANASFALFPGDVVPNVFVVTGS